MNISLRYTSSAKIPSPVKVLPNYFVIPDNIKSKSQNTLPNDILYLHLNSFLDVKSFIRLTETVNKKLSCTYL